METVKSVYGREPSKGVNPDEAVAIDRPMMTTHLGGEDFDIVLVNHIPSEFKKETVSPKH